MSYIAERRQEEKERRRAEILDAAEAVAAKEGWDALTVDQVARKARLSRALVYVYFKDKTDLLFGLGERAMQALKQRFDEATTRNRRGLDQILGMGRAYLAFTQEFPVYFEVMAHCELLGEDTAEVNPNEEACRHGGDAVKALMVASLATGVKDGSIRSDVGDFKTVALVLWGFMHGVLQLATTKPNILAHDGVQTGTLLQQALLMATRSVAATE